MTTFAALGLLGAVLSCVGCLHEPTRTPDHGGELRSAPQAGGPAVHEAPEIRQDRLAQSAVDAPRRIVIHNSYLTAQHVFLDSQAIGLVPQAAERSFDVPEGAHFPTLSDSPDGPSNVQYVGEVFERGFEYRYEVVAR